MFDRSSWTFLGRRCFLKMASSWLAYGVLGFSHGFRSRFLLFLGDLFKKGVLEGRCFRLDVALLRFSKSDIFFHKLPLKRLEVDEAPVG